MRQWVGKDAKKKKTYKKTQKIAYSLPGSTVALWYFPTAGNHRAVDRNIIFIAAIL